MALECLQVFHIWVTSPYIWGVCVCVHNVSSYQCVRVQKAVNTTETASADTHKCRVTLWVKLHFTGFVEYADRSGDTNTITITFSLISLHSDKSNSASVTKLCLSRNSSSIFMWASTTVNAPCMAEVNFEDRNTRWCEYISIGLVTDLTRAKCVAAFTLLTWIFFRATDVLSSRYLARYTSLNWPRPIFFSIWKLASELWPISGCNGFWRKQEKCN